MWTICILGLSRHWVTFPGLLHSFFLNYYFLYYSLTCSYASKLKCTCCSGCRRLWWPPPPKKNIINCHKILGRGGKGNLQNLCVRKALRESGDGCTLPAPPSGRTPQSKMQNFSNWLLTLRAFWICAFFWCIVYALFLQNACISLILQHDLTCFNFIWHMQSRA